jgi:hypothetical protein
MGYSKIKKIRLGKWDKIWSQMVRTRDERCAYKYCPNGNLAAHHIKGRSCKATRFLISNGISLCPSHHVFNHEFSAHKTPEKFERWFKKEFPERWKQIRAKTKTIQTERQAILEFQSLIKESE